MILLPPICRDNAELARLRSGLAVLGADERTGALTHSLAHGEKLWVSAGQGGPEGRPVRHLTRPPAPWPQFGAIHVHCLLTHGHTVSHMSYFHWEDKYF